jgi:uncharacterized protein
MDEHPVEPLGPDSRFRFSCDPGVRCFNACCRDLSQLLTPYDILRLKNALGLRSEAFLERYATIHVGQGSGLPVVCLRQDPADDLRCPFVSPEGCRVYADRPSSCRIYPLVRMVGRSRETGEIVERYGLIREEHCAGFENGPEWTPRQWLADQDLGAYNEMNDLLMEIVALKNRHPGTLDAPRRRLFHLAAYDLDRFRETVLEAGELDDRTDPAERAAAREDDAALLRLSLEWLRERLFGKE